MFRNYILIAVRNLLKYKFYSAINIIGLGIGIASVILIMLFIQDQYSYDSQHVNQDRIYRVIRAFKSENGEKVYDWRLSGAAGPALIQDLPEVEAAVRTMIRREWIQHEDKIFNQAFCLADPNFLDIFTFPLIRGDKTALLQPNSVLITESAAKKFFGEKDPIGKVINVGEGYVEGDYTIAGIMRDVLTHSTLQFDFLSYSVHPEFTTWYEWRPRARWRAFSIHVLLKKDISPASIESKFPAFIERHMGREIAVNMAYFLQPLEEVYLYSKRDYDLRHTYASEGKIPQGNITQVNTVFFAAIFILLIACINFTNLATARSANRAREVGLRKVVGASRKNLICQFIGESSLLAVISLVIGISIVELALPIFNTYAGINLSLGFNSGLILEFLGLALLVSLIGGSYPAFYLSHFRPIETLRGRLNTGSRGKVLRQGLIIFQFGISIVLIVVTFIVLGQVHYIQNKNLGFVKDQVIAMPIFWEHRKSPDGMSDSLNKRYNVVKQAFLQHPNIIRATISRFKHGIDAPLNSFSAYQGEQNERWMQINEVDEDFIPFFDIELIDGRNFSKNAVSNFFTGEQEYILNEAAVKALGWTEPIGKRFGFKGQKSGVVVGVVKNYHTQSLYESIEPMVLCPSDYVPKILYLRVSPEYFDETVAFMKQTWEQFLPSRPFSYTFLDDDLMLQYENERQLSKAIGVFSMLSIFIACLGLLGLVSFLTEQRRKEVGIRKVLGASETNIIVLMLTESFKLFLIAYLLAGPISYMAIMSWLQGFAYRIDMTIVPFLVGGICAFTISIFSVIPQVLKAAHINPVEALKH